MPDAARYDLDFRPASYWAPENAIEALLVNVQGEVRRRALRESLRQGDVSALDTFLARTRLGDRAREALGRIHPALMGGEYLPRSGRHEVEIARVCLESVLADVVSVRARQTSRGWRYRVVDEYDTVFHVRPASSRRPLSMGELVRLMDSAARDECPDGLTSSYRESNVEAVELYDDPEERRSYIGRLESFVAVTSGFYPQLGAWYEEEAREWLVAALERLREQEEEEEAYR